jgi:hypothetical protein
VFATLLKLLKNPKPIVNNYHAGFRNYHSSPGKLLLISIAITALQVTFVNPNVLGMVINVQNINTQYFFLTDAYSDRIDHFLSGIHSPTGRSFQAYHFSDLHIKFRLDCFHHSK